MYLTLVLLTYQGSAGLLLTNCSLTEHFFYYLCGTTVAAIKIQPRVEYSLYTELFLSLHVVYPLSVLFHS